jgi:hypothetical protein
MTAASCSAADEAALFAGYSNPRTCRLSGYQRHTTRRTCQLERYGRPDSGEEPIGNVVTRLNAMTPPVGDRYDDMTPIGR